MVPSEAAAVAPVANPLANLLTRHLLRDGEVIHLVLKPSLWFICLTSLRFIAATLIVAIGAKLWLHGYTHFYVESTVFCIGGRLMFATLSWMGRLYVLTDQRVLRLSGIFTVDIHDCPLRKVLKTRINSAFRERITGVGTIEIIPQEEERACGWWQMVRRPREVHERIEAAVRRAKCL